MKKIIGVIFIVGLAAIFFLINRPNSTPVIEEESAQKVKSSCEEMLNLTNDFENTKNIPTNIDYSFLPESENFKTRTEESVKEGANFAGHFNVATWGCGTDCFGYSIVDMNSGKVVEYSPVHEGYHLGNFSVDTEYLIHNPVFAGEDRNYYELIRNGETIELTLICTEKSEQDMYGAPQ